MGNILNNLAQQWIDEGRYPSVEEMAEDMKRLVASEDERIKEAKQHILNEIQIGLDQLDHGEGITYDSPADHIAAIERQLNVDRPE